MPGWRLPGGHGRASQGGLPGRRTTAGGGTTTRAWCARPTWSPTGSSSAAARRCTPSLPERRRTRAPERGCARDVVVRERAELLDPEPLYLRRPDVDGAARAQAGLVSRSAQRPATTSPASWRSRSSCSGRTPGRSGPVSPTLARGSVLVAEDEARRRATWSLADAGDVADLQRIGVRRDHQRAGLASAARSTRRSATPGPTGCCSRCVPTTSRALAFYAARRVRGDRPSPPLLPRRHRRARPRAGPASPTSRRRWNDDVVNQRGPLVLGIETSCDETGVGIVRGHTLLADAVASVRRGARPLRRRRTGGRVAGPPRGDGADARNGPATTPGSSSPTSTRSR